MKPCFTFLCLLLVSTVHAADIVIAGPTGPITPNTEVVLRVSGLTEAERLQAVARSVPPATLKPDKLSSGEIVIFFSANQTGPHRVSVAVKIPDPEWLTLIARGSDGATAASIDPRDQADISSLAKRLASTYTQRSGSFTVRVGPIAPDPVPPRPEPPVPPRPTPDPPRPAPIAVGAVTTIVIRIAGTITADQSEVLSDLRQWADGQPKEKVRVFEVAPDAINPDGTPNEKIAAFVRLIPPNTNLPYVFLSRLRSDGRGDILYHGELPATADELIARIQQYMSSATLPLIPRGNK